MTFEEHSDSTEENELKLLSNMALASNEIDWKPAIILSELYLEKFAKNKVQNIFKNRKLKLHKKIERLGLTEVTLFLYTLHEINSKEFTEINKLQKARHSILHPKKSTEPLFYGEKANKKYKPLIQNAIKVISSLKNH